MTGRDQRPRDGWTAKGIVVGEIDVGDVGVDRHPDLGQERNGPLEPSPARQPLGGERGLERIVGRVHPESEDVELAVLERDAARDRVDLDAGDQLKPCRNGIR